MRSHRRILPVGAAVAALLLAPATAGADAIDEIGKRLVKLQSEAQQLTSGIRKPKKTQSRDVATRRLIDAQVAYGVGGYDEAALMLYDFVGKNKNHPDFDVALYYLAESLYQKGDYLASRSYFTQLVTEERSSKYFQQSLQRLIELSLELRDEVNVDQWLSALESVPESKKRPSVPYVQGKYAYFSDDFPEAIGYFRKVPTSSQYWFQAQYLIGASHVAQDDLGKAARLYAGLVKRKPKNNDDKRVVELAHMALGRLHYERDQPSKAIDEYLMISRRSDLFDEALFEVAWVYVKNDQYDKALRALELLALADPTSQQMPTVRILEGNLRIRKAQVLAEEQRGNSVEEYVKAIRTFENTHDAFKGPHDELVRIMEEREDPRLFLAQITGRQSETFDTNAVLPPVAAAWLREEPEVERIVGIETDLGQIRDEISEAEATIERLEQALASPSRVNIFPTLAEKRTRATEILEELFSLRQQLATHERALVRKYANDSERRELDRLQSERQDIARALADLPGSEVAYGERIERARNAYDELDKQASEIRVIIDSTNATLVALKKYLQQTDDELSAEDTEAINTQIAELEKEIEEMHAEFDAIRREAVLAKDEAGTGDEVAQRAALLRDKLRQALDDEHAYMTRIMTRMSGKDRAKADQITSLTRTANATTVTLDDANAKIEDIVEIVLADVRGSLDDEKVALANYKRDFLNYEAESRELGGEVLEDAFASVKDQFYDVVVQSEVGVIDVTWSQKEATDEAMRRLELDRQRELRTLHEDFRDILEEGDL